MAYPERKRLWDMRSSGGKSVLEVYTEKDGWKPSGNRAEQDHHAIPESEMIEKGFNPDISPSMPLGRNEHVGPGTILDPETGELRMAGYGERAYSCHPDIYNALTDYQAGDADAFKKAAKKHIEAARNGESILNADPQLQGYLVEKAEEREMKYALEHPEDPMPVIKHRNKSPGASFWDIFTGKRGYEEDQE